MILPIGTVKELIKTFDADGDGMIEWQEFVHEFGTKPHQLQAMLLALFRFASQSRRVMILLHLVTGTSRDSDVDVWSWRTANSVARELSKEDEQAAARPLCSPRAPALLARSRAPTLARALRRLSCAS